MQKGMVFGFDSFYRFSLPPLHWCHDENKESFRIESRDIPDVLLFVGTAVHRISYVPVLGIISLWGARV